MTEPTSVLVLSAPSGLFVDVRLTLNQPIPGISSDPHTLPSEISQARPFQPGSDFKALEFANAGQATYSTPSQEDAPPGTIRKRGKWTHWCSTEISEAGYDTGDVLVRDDGSVLETGTMAHPESKQMTPYYEVWVDEKPVFAPQEPGAKKRTKGSHVIIRCEDEERQIRGMIAWVGRYCQGIVRQGEDLYVERWEFDEGDHGGRGAWARTWKSGRGPPLPCGWVVKEEEPVKNSAVLNPPDLDGKGAEWHVLETDFEWG